MNTTKGTVDEDEDTGNAGGWHGYPVLIKTDMSQDMAYDVSCIDFLYHIIQTFLSRFN